MTLDAPVDIAKGLNRSQWKNQGVLILTFASTSIGIFPDYSAGFVEPCQVKEWDEDGDKNYFCVVGFLVCP